MSPVRIAIVLAGAALAAAPAQALAAPEALSPGPYHGGALAEGGPALAYLRLAEDGRSFEAAITLRADCDDYPVPVQARIAVPEAELAEDGTATVVRSVTGDVSGPDGRPAREDGTSTVTVAFAPDGRVTGSVRLASTFRDAESGEPVADCDTGEVAFAARIVAAGSSRGRFRRPRRAGDLLGVAGVQPLVARVSARGDVEGLAFVYRSGCQLRADGRGTRRIVNLPDFRVRPDGRFSVRASQLLLVPGGEERVRIELRGRSRPDGTLRATVRLRGERDSGDTCDSGRLRIRTLPALDGDDVPG